MAWRRFTGADRADLRAGRRGVALELLRREAPQEDRERGVDLLRRRLLPEGAPRERAEVLRRLAPLEEVVEEEVVQLVAAEESLGLLRLRAARDELGRDGRRAHVAQDGGDARGGGVRLALDDPAHKRLRDAAVHVVHRHLVAVVGRPPERDLGEVAGADDEAALLVRQVHQHLRALAGLGVLVGDVAHLRVVADVGEVALHGGADRDGAQLRAEQLRELLGVAARARGRAEAGHRDGERRGAREAEQVGRARADEQGERRVEPAGDAEDEPLRAGALHAPGEPGALDREDLAAARLARGGVGRDERARVDAQPREVGRLR